MIIYDDTDYDDDDNDDPQTLIMWWRLYGNDNGDDGIVTMTMKMTTMNMRILTALKMTVKISYYVWNWMKPFFTYSFEHSTYSTWTRSVEHRSSFVVILEMIIYDDTDYDDDDNDNPQSSDNVMTTIRQWQWRRRHCYITALLYVFRIDKHCGSATVPVLPI